MTPRTIFSHTSRSNQPLLISAPIHFTASRWQLSVCTILFLFLLSWIPRLLAAEASSSLAPNDWRQLWWREDWERWERKPESELKRLADSGQPAAQYMLWYKWTESRTNRAEAGAMLEAATKAGLPQALYDTGLLSGRADLIEKAAEAGYIRAELHLAESASGFTWDPKVKPDQERALRHFRRAVENGSSEAMVNLAILYSSGVGEPRTEAESPHRLLVQAAVMGNRGAMSQLSDRYAYGYGEIRDPLNAARWRYLALRGSKVPLEPFEVVDDQGNPKQQDSLEADDLAKALSLFIKAVDHKDPAAAATLAKQHLEAGKLAESMLLYQFAKELGSSEAATELKKIEPTVTPEQKKVAEARLPFLRKP